MPEAERARAVRPGEELDSEAVDAWLKAHGVDHGHLDGITQYTGGASNWTYRLAYEKDDLILRRPPAGTKAKGAHDMGREYRVQAALAPVFPLVPAMVAHCDDTSVIGSEFYVMRPVDGLIPRKDFHGIDERQARAMSEAFVDTLVALHDVDVKATGLDALGKGPGYPRRQIDGWSARYRKARTWNVPRFEDVMTWLAARVPEDVEACVIHNDFRLDNLVLDPGDPTRVRGVLDWEMATVGDPLMDLGNALAYWIGPTDGWLALRIRRQPSHLPGMMTRAEVVERYLDARGLPRRDLAFYEVYGVFRLAVIVQQIYYRYHHGQTRNPAFRHFWLVVHYLHRRCRRLIRDSQRS